MRLFNKSVAVVAALVGLLIGGGAGFASIINAVGLDNATESNWRTASVAKPFDGDGNNVYGSLGYFLFATGNATNFSGGAFAPGLDINGLPSWVALSSANNANAARYSGAYQMIDNPTTTPGGSPTTINTGFSWQNGVTAGVDTPLFDLTLGAGTPSHAFRLGLIENDASDNIASFKLKSGASSDSVAIGGATQNDGHTRYVFFDISNPAPGDVLVISGTTATTAVPGNILGLSGLSFDVSPEPASLSLLAVGGLMLIRRGRRVS